MTNFGFVINHATCIGCYACTVACKAENEVPLGTFRTWVKYVEKGRYPNTRRHFAVLRCNHCDTAPCMTICPVTALFRRENGIVDFDGDKCIGCKACLQACPYDALYINPRTNTAEKCNFCAHRVELGMKPACEIVCPERAIISGDLDDPDSEISRLVVRENVQVRKPEQGTKPKVFYVEADATAAAHVIVWGRFRERFWVHVVGLGIALPVLMLAFFAGSAPPAPLTIIAALLALYGFYVYEELWIKAGQAIPLS